MIYININLFIIKLRKPDILNKSQENIMSCSIYLYTGESLRLPTPSRISVTIRYINTFYIYKLLVI